LLDDGKASHRLTLGVVRRAFGEVGLLAILLAFGFADRDGHGQVEAAEELLEIDGILSGGIDSDMEVGQGMQVAQLIQATLEGLIAIAVLHDGERRGSGFPIVLEERDTMSIACGINTDADRVEGRGCRHKLISGAEKRWMGLEQRVPKRIV
jgi:hypothetical protein